MFVLTENPLQGAPEVRAVAGGGRRSRGFRAARTGGVGPVQQCRNVLSIVPEEERAAENPKNPRLARLAEQIRQLCTRGQAPPARCPSGLPALDAALAGGFAAAAVHELLAPEEGAAACSVALLTATRAAGPDKWVLYIDTQQDFYPPGAGQMGVPLGRLLVVRALRQADALWVCEQALRCRAVAAVVLPLPAVDARASRRLQLAAEAGGGLGLLIRREERGGPSFAASRLRCEPMVGAHNIRRIRVTMLKQRDGWSHEPFIVEFCDAPNPLPAPAALVDRAGATRRRVGG